jgi:uncharacterized membrane protein YjgN (DUF898 family)
MAKQTRFTFDGGAGSFLGTALLGVLVTVFTLGICYPFALVLMNRWQARHTFIDGEPLVFTGSATGLFGQWVKWLLLCIVTLGIYSFWVAPRLQAWVTTNTEFARQVAPLQPYAAGHQGQTPSLAGQPVGSVTVAEPVAAPVAISQ